MKDFLDAGVVAGACDFVDCVSGAGLLTVEPHA